MVLKSHTTSSIIFTWFSSLTPLRVYSLHGYTVWHHLKYTFYMCSELDTTERYVFTWFSSLTPLKRYFLTWFYSLTPLKIYFLPGFTVRHHLKYTFYMILQFDTICGIPFTRFNSLTPLQVYFLHCFTAWHHLTLSGPGGHFVSPSPKSQDVFKTAWRLELLFCDFSFCVFSI